MVVVVAIEIHSFFRRACRHVHNLRKCQCHHICSLDSYGEDSLVVYADLDAHVAFQVSDKGSDEWSRASVLTGVDSFAIRNDPKDV